MERFEVSSDVVENYSLLPSIFENYLSVVKVSSKDFLDMCFAMCMRNWYHGGNDRSLSIDKFIIGNSREWIQILSKLGVSAVSGAADSGLPRVQQQRVLFDAMSYSLCKVKDTEIVSNIKIALKKVGLAQLFVTIDSNSYFSRGKELLRGTVEDYSESDLVTSYRFYAEFLNICNGVADEEKKEEDVDLSDDAKKSLEEMNNWYESFTKLIRSQISVYSSLGKDVSGIISELESCLRTFEVYSKDKVSPICTLMTLTEDIKVREVFNDKHEVYKAIFANKLINIAFYVINSSYKKSSLVTLRRIESCKSLCPISINTEKWGIPTEQYSISQAIDVELKRLIYTDSGHILDNNSVNKVIELLRTVLK